jgi:hypothetical protein
MTKKMVRLRRQFQNLDVAYSSIRLGTTPIMKLEVAENPRFGGGCEYCGWQEIMAWGQSSTMIGRRVRCKLLTQL